MATLRGFGRGGRCKEKDVDSAFIKGWNGRVQVGDVGGIMSEIDTGIVLGGRRKKATWR